MQALQDLQKSIELNRNRAIYRSRLLLDQDLAARSAGLGRIYRDLGFQQLALLEGWKSLATDPGNYSAHRFLADSYAGLPRHEIARVSELLQSQLWQPINLTPIQPQLAESDLFIVEGSGPSDPSFNEFNPLFHRNRFALQANGAGGKNDTLGNDLVHSAVLGRWSYSLGQFHYDTEGFRRNHDRDQDIYNLFTQVSLSHKTSLQAELRRVDRKHGQLDLLFDPSISPDFGRETDADSLRLGFHHAFSPRSDIVASLIYQDIDLDQSIITHEHQTELEERRDGFLGELGHLLRSGPLRVTSRIGHLHQEFKEKVFIDLLPFSLPGLPFIIDPPPTRIPPQRGVVRRTNLYSYAQLQITGTLSLTAGISADFLKIGGQIDYDQVNPKFGLLWQLLPETTLRAAVFRERGVRLHFSQTIEPTQVAGFNQFFDDINGTDSRRYGAAIDHKFSSQLFGGLEYSGRDLDVPLLSGDTGERARFFDWREQLGRAYLYWAPDPRFALSAEYQFERVDRKGESFRRGIEDVKTHRAPLGFHLFLSSGFSIKIQGTYVSQSGNFNKRDSDDVFSGAEDFGLLDASIHYRLPKRYGLLTIGARNLSDEKFKFQDTDTEDPLFIPERLVFVKFTLAF